MKKPTNLLTLLILFLMMFGLSTPVFALPLDPPEPIDEDKVVIGQTFILKEDQELNGDLVVIGGTAILKPNSEVNGEIALIGGVLDVYGTINGDIQAMGGSLELMDGSVVNGSLYNYGSTITQNEGAVIEGQQIANLPFDFDFSTLPFVEQSPVPEINVTTRQIGGFIGNFLWAIVQVLAVAALAILVILLAPQATDKVATSLGKQPFVHWGIGLLTIFAAPTIFVILLITIILIPLGLLGFIALGFAVLYGWIALGYEVGRRLFNNSASNLSPALKAGLGTLILTAVSRLAAIVPCVGWTVGAVLALFGLGAVILTRFGTRDYPPTAPLPSKPVAYVPPQAPITKDSGIKEPTLTEIFADDDFDGEDELFDEDLEEDFNDLDDQTDFKNNEE